VRIYFSMSLSPYYTDAVSLMAAAARAQGDIEVFVNISEYEQSFMTFDRMTAPEAERRAWLGGLVADWLRGQQPGHRRRAARAVATARRERRLDPEL
jgi:hypothetical protein